MLTGVIAHVHHWARRPSKFFHLTFSSILLGNMSLTVDTNLISIVFYADIFNTMSGHCWSIFRSTFHPINNPWQDLQCFLFGFQVNIYAPNVLCSSLFFVIRNGLGISAGNWIKMYTKICLNSQVTSKLVCDRNSSYLSLLRCAIWKVMAVLWPSLHGVAQKVPWLGVVVNLVLHKDEHTLALQSTINLLWHH